VVSTLVRDVTHGRAEQSPQLDWARKRSGRDRLSGDRPVTHGRTVCVPGDEIAAAVSAWLAELGTHSPLVEDLARAARAGDWAVAHALGEHLSVRVTSLTATATGRTNP